MNVLAKLRSRKLVGASYDERVKKMFLVTALAASLAWADVTVAADASAQFRTVQAAIDAAPGNARFTIRIKPGTYKEHITIAKEKRFVNLIGEDAATTILTYDRYAALPGNDGKPIGTFQTPSTVIQADDFIAENLTFDNSSGNKGTVNGQAVALAVFGDRAIFRNCRLIGWQDTLLVNAGRQYFESTTIEGAVDFIFGAATVWFENCRIVVKGRGYITAASTPQDAKFGYVFSHCKIAAEPGVTTYLGRPWRDFAAVMFLSTEMPAAIRTEGWHNWNQPDREKTSRYAEYRSSGEGANPEARAAWSRQLSDEEAAGITLKTVMGDWDPRSGSAK
jgi:pectinesterase